MTAMHDCTIRLVGLNCWQAGAALPQSRAQGLYILRAYAERDPVVRARARIQVIDVWFSDRHAEIERIVRPGARVLGLSCDTWSIPWVERMARAARKREPELIILYGGYSVPRLLQRNRISWCDRDIVVPGMIGRSEEPFRELAAGLVTDGDLSTSALAKIPGIAWWDGTGFHTNPPGTYLSLASCPSPIDGRMPFDPAADNMVVRSSRGCPSQCRFCVGSRDLQPEIWRSAGLDCAPIENVAREIDWAVNLGCRNLDLNDSAINYDPEHMGRVLEHLPFDELDAVTMAMSFLKLDGDVCARLCKCPSGVLRLRFGAQSLSAATCEQVGRRHFGVEHIRRALAPLVGHSKLTVDLMFPLPGDTLASFQRDVGSLLEIDGVDTNINQMALSPQLGFGREPGRWGIELEEIDGMQFAVGCDGFPPADVETAIDWMRELDVPGLAVRDIRSWYAYTSSQPGPPLTPAVALHAGPSRELPQAEETETTPSRPAVRLRIEDSRGVSEFFVARAEPGDRYYRRLDDIIVWYTQCASPDLLQAVTDLLLDTINARDDSLCHETLMAWRDAVDHAVRPLAAERRITVEIG